MSMTVHVAILVMGAAAQSVSRAEAAVPPGPSPLSPAALVAAPDGRTLFVGCATGRRVLRVDTATRDVVQSIEVPDAPLGLALTRDGAWLYAACASPSSTVCVIETATGRIRQTLRAGHTAMAPVLSADERRLYVCNRFTHDVSEFDLDTGQEADRIRVSREPVAAALTPDGSLLLVANHLYDELADGAGVAATLSVISTRAHAVVKQLKLPRGAGLLRGVAVSPDGRFAAVTHTLARYYLPTTEVDFGSMNGNAISLVDLQRLEWFRFLQLDFAGRGAANPWAITWTPDNRSVVVTHAGTHEVSVVDAPVWPQKPVRVRQRIDLPGHGPRALAAIGSRVYLAHYFSDDLCVLDLAAAEPTAERIALAAPGEPTLVRQGEQLFNDARLCRQQWQSCASCHDADGRMDGLHWDLLNDGVGNPKNVKSLVGAHGTPPSMALGIRRDAETAVRAGLRHILFTNAPGEVPSAIDAYLKSLQPVPSPHLINGQLSPVAQRGQAIFLRRDLGCARCHPPPRFTDQRRHDVGTLGRYDRPNDRFDTPALVELWRTAPYLHDGSARTLREVLGAKSAPEGHGRAAGLAPEDLAELIEYLLSL